MKYNDYKNNIKSGDLIAWTTKGFKNPIAQLVRLFTESEYEHIAIAWVISGRIFVIEAVHPLVRIYPLSDRLPFYTIPMNIEWNDDREKFLLSKVGKSYSFWNAIKSYFKKINPNNEWECAQLALEFYKDANITLDANATPSALIESILILPDSKLIMVV